MKRSLEKSLIVCGCLMTSVLCEAQDIRGKVLDERGEVLPYANVVLLDREDSTFIQGTVTAADGSFKLHLPQDQSFLLRFTAVGYEPLYTLAKENMGEVRLKEQTHNLKGVEVTTDRPKYKMVNGGIGIDIAHSALSKAGSALDVLGMLPRVHVDEKGEVSVFAKGTPLVYINRRQVRDMNELSQLKSSDIKDIQVVTNPGAKYDASVKSVILITTSRPKGEGVSVRTDHNVKYNGKQVGTFQEGYVKFRKDGWEVFADGIYGSKPWAERNNFTVEMQGKDHVRIPQFVKDDTRTNYVWGNVGFNYDFNERHSVGGSYKVYTYLYDKAKADEMSQRIYRNGELEGTVSQDFMKSDGLLTHEADAYYLGKIGKWGIDLNLTYYWKKNTTDTKESEKSEELEDRVVNTRNTQRNHLLAGKLVLDYPLWKGSFNIGTELTSSTAKGRYVNAEGYVDASDTRIKERNVAGFIAYTRSFGNFSFNAGLRYEHVVADYYSFGKKEEEPSRTYNNWFPDLSLSWNKDNLGMQLVYTSKTTRPSYNNLRNEVQYDNRYVYEGGNPYLRPTILHGLSYMLTYKWLSFSTEYDLLRHDINQVFTFYKNQDIAFFTSENFKHTENLTVSLVASPSFGWYHPTFEADLKQQFFHPGAFDSGVNLNKPGFFFSLNNQFTLPAGFLLFVNGSFNTRQYSGLGVSKPSGSLDARVVKSFFHEALTFNLSATDLLKTSKDTFNMYAPRIQCSRDAYTYSRSVRLTVTYKFNTSESRYKGKGAGNQEKGRM